MGGCGPLSSCRRARRQHLGSLAPLAILAPSRAVAGHIAAQRQAGKRSAPYENPIQPPPIPTPAHSKTETTATTLLQSGRSRLSWVMITLRWIVKVKTIARNRHDILNQKASW